MQEKERERDRERERERERDLYTKSLKRSLKISRGLAIVDMFREQFACSGICDFSFEE